MELPTYSQLCDITHLEMAWQHVRDKKSGGGIDKQTVAQFGENAEENLQELLEMLKAGSYVPEPYLEITIPKDVHERRKLGLPTVRDKILQQAVKMLIEPVLDTSYG